MDAYMDVDHAGTNTVNASQIKLEDTGIHSGIKRAGREKSRSPSKVGSLHLLM